MDGAVQNEATDVVEIWLDKFGVCFKRIGMLKFNIFIKKQIELVML
jgi:hypothetical protein